MIGRPTQVKGVSLAELFNTLCSRFGCRRAPHVCVVGIGPGSRGAVTHEVREAIGRADCLIGAGRMLEAVALPGQHTYEAIAPGDIADFIATQREYQRFAVVLSGDTGFFSGAKKLLPRLNAYSVDVLPGVSSLAYFCAKLQTSYDDVFVVSVHGRQRNIVPDVRANQRVFLLVGGAGAMNDMCRSLVDAGLGCVSVSIGERLSYPDEKITQGTAAVLADGVYESLAVALIENDWPDAVVTHGIPDDAFLRRLQPAASSR